MCIITTLLFISELPKLFEEWSHIGSIVWRNGRHVTSFAEVSNENKKRGLLQKLMSILPVIWLKTKKKKDFRQKLILYLSDFTGNPNAKNYLRSRRRFDFSQNYRKITLLEITRGCTKLLHRPHFGHL